MTDTRSQCRGGACLRTPKRVAGRAWLCIILGSLLTTGAGCSVITGQNPASILFGQQSSGIRGFTAVVCLNSSTALVQTVVALAYPGEPPQVWVIPVAPTSWDSILVECGFSEIRVISATPVNLDTGEEQETIDYDGDALVEGQDIICGSIVVLEIDDASAETTDASVTIDVSAVPASVPSRATAQLTTALSPGSESGLSIIRPELPEGVAADVFASWEDDTGRVFISQWTLNGGGPAIASLVECPIAQIGWGNLSDATAPGATLDDGATVLTAPASLVTGAGFACGDGVILRLVESAENPQGYELETEATTTDSSQPVAGLDLFGNIRQLLDDKGFAGLLSNGGMLLPAPPTPGDETP